MRGAQVKIVPSPGTNDDTRKRLLGAATDVFAEHGYHGGTVREICRVAKVNLALVNYHFGDKMALYTEVLRSAMTDLERMRRVKDLFAENEKPEWKLRKVITLMLDLMLRRKESNPLNMRLLMHELARPTSAIDRVVDDSIKPLYNLLSGLVAELSGLSPEDKKTKLCTQSIIAQVLHYSHHSAVMFRLWPELTMSPPQQQMVADHIVDFSLSHLKGTKSTKKGRAAKS